MFIRIKKIKEKHYAYHVQNRRVYGKVKQKVKEYLGKAYISKKTNNISFFEFVKSDASSYHQGKSYKEIIEDLIRWELFKNNLNEIQVNTKRYSVSQENQNVVLKLNDGYLYNKTLTELLKFQAVGDDEYFIGQEFAELFVKAGIDIPKELFVKMFEKITQK